MKKGQALSMDFLFAVIIVLTIISSMGIVIMQFSTMEAQIETNRDTELKAQSAITTLTQTQGYPPDWEDLI